MYFDWSEGDEEYDEEVGGETEGENAVSNNNKSNSADLSNKEKKSSVGVEIDYNDILNKSFSKLTDNERNLLFFSD
jgi:hypothetical protein